MRKHPLAAVVAALIVTAPTGPAGAADGPRLQMYEATVDGATAEALATEGLDVVSREAVRDGVRVVLVLYPSDRETVERRGVDLRLWRNEEGLTARRLADRQRAAGLRVWRAYDGPGGIREYLYDVAAGNPDIVKLEVVGITHGTDPAGGDPTPREIIALKLTKNATTVPDGTRPGVLYSTTPHGREWIGTEVTRRLLERFITGWRAQEPRVVDILTTTELWFVPVVNPDGYQYTFTHDRLWRKNVADIDGDGEVTPVDGADPNRIVPGQTPEPETQAMIEALERSQAEFRVIYHSFGEQPSDVTSLEHTGTLTLTPELGGSLGDGLLLSDRGRVVRHEVNANLDVALATAQAAADTLALSSSVTTRSRPDERRA